MLSEFFLTMFGVFKELILGRKELSLPFFKLCCFHGIITCVDKSETGLRLIGLNMLLAVRGFVLVGASENLFIAGLG